MFVHSPKAFSVLACKSEKKITLTFQKLESEKFDLSFLYLKAQYYHNNQVMFILIVDNESNNRLMQLYFTVINGWVHLL